MLRNWISTIGVPALAAASLLLAAQPSMAQHHGGGSHGGSYHGGSYYGGYHQGGYSHPGYYPGYSYHYGYYPYYHHGYYPNYSYLGLGYPYGYPSYGPAFAGSDYPGYTVYSPSVSSYQAFYPPPDNSTVVAPRDNSVHLAIRVPADAEVWIDGVKGAQAGTQREFVSPPVTPGQDYWYSIRARWMDGDRTMDLTRKLKVHAGEMVNVDFNRAVKGEVR